MWDRLNSLSIDHFVKRVKDLKSFRDSILRLAFYVALIISIAVIPYHFTRSSPIEVVYGLCIPVIAFLGLWLVNHEKQLLAAILLYVFENVSLTLLYLSEATPTMHPILVICLYPLINIFLIQKRQLALWMYLFSVGILISILSYRNQLEAEVFIALTSFFVFFYILDYFITYLQDSLINQNKKSQELNDDLMDLNKDLKEKNDKIQLFTNSLVHDIKAPLRSIKGFSYLINKELHKEATSKEKVDEYITTIDLSIKSLEDQINDLLEYTKNEISDLEISVFNVGQIIESELLKLKYQIDSSNAQIELNNLGNIKADLRGIRTLLANLISNALKYQPKTEGHAPRLSISQVNEKDKTILFIKDNGIGMDKKYCQTIFEPFRRLHSSAEYAGTGLGLSICKSIVEKHKGTVKVESEPGYGSKFIIILPRHCSDTNNLIYLENRPPTKNAV